MSRTFSRQALLLASVSFVGLAASGHLALANPEGGTVEAGSATIGSTDNKTLEINQQSQRAIINWDSFNIGEGETTRFILPNAQAVTLNRDLGGMRSEIHGNIESNGRFFLVNPNGILFGPGSRVDVAGLVATTHDIRSQDFMAGRYEFNIPGQPDASVITQGDVSIQDLGFGAFVAPHVRNEGVIAARMGRVELASASGFTLDMHGDRLISFLIENPNEHQIFDADGNPVSALVENTGEVVADGGVVAMSASAARGVVDSVINTDGIVQANTVEQRGGKIILGGGNNGVVRVAGQTTARGNGHQDEGGEIEVTGEFLWADEFSRFDVSGMRGGGRFFFGGDYLGGSVDAETAEQNGFSLEAREIQNARAVRMDAGSVVSADAIASGDGGKVILWSDDSTRFAGEITARGGASGGNGGTVETSGRYSLDVTGTVDASAANGKSGIWLLDPTADIYIVGTGQSQVIDSSTSGGSFFLAPIASPSFVRAQTIETALNSGTNVKVQTYNFAGEQGPGAIHLQSNILKSSGGNANLTFSANTGFYATGGNTIRSTSGRLNVFIDADADNRLGGFIDINGLNEYVIQTNGGIVDMRAWDFRIQGRAVRSSGGNVTLRHIDDYATWMTIANARGRDFVINAGSGNVLLDTNFASDDFGNRIELGNYAIRGNHITIDAAEVTNIGEGFAWANDEYSYTTPSFNDADGIGELFYRSITYRGGAVPGTIDGSIISDTVLLDIRRVEQFVQQASEPVMYDHPRQHLQEREVAIADVSRELGYAGVRDLSDKVVGTFLKIAEMTTTVEEGIYALDQISQGAPYLGYLLNTAVRYDRIRNTDDFQRQTFIEIFDFAAQVTTLKSGALVGAKVGGATTFKFLGAGAIPGAMIGGAGSSITYSWTTSSEARALAAEYWDNYQERLARRADILRSGGEAGGQSGGAF